MKKYLLTVAGFIATVGLSGQSIIDSKAITVPYADKYSAKNVLTEVPPNAGMGSTRAGGGSGNQLQSFGDTLFAETFGDGMNGDGANGAWTNAGNANWEYRGLSTTPNNTVGSRGAYSAGAPSNPINSPTQANGFMIFDSDYLDNGGDPNNMGGGTSPTPHMGMLETPSMDFSGYNSIYLLMNSFFRRFQGTAYVLFSTDGGTTWGDTISIYDADFPVNSTTDNSEVKGIPISPNVTNNTNVKARFVFDGVTESNANGSGYYMWQIDDIYFVEAPDCDLSLDNLFHNSPSDLVITRNYTKYYGQVPSNQSASDTLRYGGFVNNKGGAAQLNSRIDLYINGTLETTTNSTTIAINAEDSLGSQSQVNLNRAPGRYVMDYVAASDCPDAVPSDDTIKHVLDITDTALSWVRRDNVSDNGTFFTQTTNYSVGSLISIIQDDTVKGFDFYVSTGNVNNPEIILTLWRVDIQGQNLNVTTVAQEFATLTQNLTGQWINFPTQDIPIQSGRYFLGWESVGDTIRWASDGDPGHNRAMRINTSGNWQFFADETNFRAPAIQLNLAGADCPVITGTVSNISEAGCGLSDGEATVTPDNPGHSVKWPDGSTNNTHSGLAAGIYNISVIDQNNCVGIVEVTIVNANAPQKQNGGLEITQEISCNFSNDPDGTFSQDGILTPTFSGGTTPYTFEWSNNQTTESNDPNNGAQVNMGAGSYRVSVIDDNNCETFSDGFVTLQPPAIMEIDVSHTPGNPTGTVEATVIAGGQAPFTYSWNTGESGATIDSKEPEPFTYEVTVTDANGCVAEGDDSPVSTADLNLAQGINIYPNPSNGQFNIEFTNLTGEYTITLRNMIGQIVGQERVNVNGSNISTLDYDNLTKGLYLVEIKEKEGSSAIYRVSIK